MDTLQTIRAREPIVRPSLLADLTRISFIKVSHSHSLSNEIQIHFPHTHSQPLLHAEVKEKRSCHPLRIGVLFSGGQAPGGHNVIAGIWDGICELHLKSSLIGFLGGPSGLLENRSIILTDEKIRPYRNQGGFELLGSGRTKIETLEQLAAALKTVQQLQLDGLIIIGGDDSNTNAAILAEYFCAQNCSTVVVGVPKTIDGDLQNEHVAISFGFDTACKTYAEMIGNIARDALSAKKYYHFIKLMGRSASHIALECALAVQPNLTLIGEEVAENKTPLKQIVSAIADLICKRNEMGKNYGLILIPEGLIEFIPECAALISDLNTLQVGQEPQDYLPEPSKKTFQTLPAAIQQQLLMNRDPHGNVQVSFIQTDQLLIHLVTEELKLRQKAEKFHPVSHFFGYEGRAGFPSAFDAHYCYALGLTSALLVDAKATGYMSCVAGLTDEVSKWKILAVPMTQLMHLEMRHQKLKPVIRKTLLSLTGKAFVQFKASRQAWCLDDTYRFPGPIQFYGEPHLVNRPPYSLILEAIH